MKKELLKISIIFFVTVFAVVWALNYIYFGQAPKSKAAGETISFIFSPASVNKSTGDFNVSVKVKPSASITVRGYQFNITFDKSKVQFKNIQYKIGFLSAGIGDEDSKATIINDRGFIKVIGEIRAPDGLPMLANEEVEAVIITFTAISPASSTITTGSGDDKFSMINSDYSLSWVLSAGPVSFSVNGGGPTNTPTPTVTPGGPTLTPTPTDNANITLDLKLKFQGILKMPKTELNKLVVKVTVKNNDLNQSATGDFVTTDGVTWHDGAIPFTIPAAAGYTILIKGPYHIQKRICDTDPTETAGGTYRCDKGEITLTAGNNNLDFSGIVLLAGDLPDQDGTISSYDTSLIRNNLGKTDDSSLANSDVNRDGVVNTQDYSLVIAALSVKNDEE